MNNIKRSKESEEEDTLLVYRFGECYNYEISKKIIRTFIKNKRIFFDNLFIHKCLDAKISKEFIKILIVKENLNDQDCLRNTPLHIAISNMYNEDIVELLITKDNIDIQNRKGNTPLHIALEVKYPSKFLRKLTTKVNINMINKKNRTPLTISKMYLKKMINHQ